MASRRSSKPVQLTLDEARRPTGRGGWRPGAGRPRGRTQVAHEKRDRFAARYPLHVTLRVADGVASIRRRSTRDIVHQAIRASGHEAGFRIVHFTVLANHIHLIIEAAHSEALGQGMQGLCVRLARGFNRVLERTGTLFAERYHARALRTPTEVRHALRYVLLNGNRHELEHGAKVIWSGVDPYSSAAWFDGWADDRWRHEGSDVPQPTAAPRTWLLTTGWTKAGGPIGFDDTPGRRKSSPSASGAPTHQRGASQPRADSRGEHLARR